MCFLSSCFSILQWWLGFCSYPLQRTHDSLSGFLYSKFSSFWTLGRVFVGSQFSDLLCIVFLRHVWFLSNGFYKPYIFIYSSVCDFKWLVGFWDSSVLHSFSLEWLGLLLTKLELIVEVIFIYFLDVMWCWWRCVTFVLAWICLPSCSNGGILCGFRVLLSCFSIVLMGWGSNYLCKSITHDVDLDLIFFFFL